jgi:SAM-dependent methyltransferase
MMRHVEKCRLCGGVLFSDQLVLNPTPLANELSESAVAAIKAEIFPLTVAMCSECSHVQLVDLITSERLFDGYAYQSGTSTYFRNHFAEFASTTSKFSGSKPILEIGSNDGTLLQSFADLGLVCVGIEPSEQLVEICIRSGLDARVGYFDESTVKNLVDEFGQFDLVVANNVLAHVDNLRQVFQDIFNSLSPEGVCVFEVAHLLSMVEQGTFDSIYHEHMSYHSLTSLAKFCNSIGFTIFDVQLVSSHGGSIRVFISKDPRIDIQDSVGMLLEVELANGLTSPDVLHTIKSRILNLKFELNNFLNSNNSNSKRITFGFGAPAKLVTFISETQLYEQDLSFIIDDNPLKQGKFIPTWAIPVIAKEQAEKIISEITGDDPGIKIRVIIFPWNLSLEIIEKLSEWLPKGTEVLWFNDGLNVREIL